MITFEEDKILQKIGLELMFNTPEKRNYSEGLTAIELSRKLNIKTDIVKKKLKILFDKGLVHCIGMNPKFWKFDEYNFQKIDENDPVYCMLCQFDDVDFDEYFKY